VRSSLSFPLLKLGQVRRYIGGAIRNGARGAVKTNLFRLNQCVFSIVLNFGSVSVDEIAGEEHNQVRVRRISWFDPGQRTRHGLNVNQKLLSRYLLRDRDSIFGDDFREQVRDMGIEEVLSAPRSPWQRAYVERVIGSIRRECLDHVIVFHEHSLRQTLKSYFDYYHGSRTHLSLGKDSPEPRAIQPPAMGSVVRCRRSEDCTTATNDGLPESARICQATRCLSLPL
jgi:hypothetical protein